MDAQVFEPNPYDDIDEGIFEKNENCFILSSLNNIALNSNPLMIRTSNSDSCDDRLMLNSSRDYILLSRKTTQNEMEEFNEPEQQCEGILKIAVRDTGCGMTEPAVAKLFQKFSQVSTDVHKRQMGTGLGLYITKEICKRMGGDIQAYSRPDVSTTFILCLPVTSVVDNSVLHIESTNNTAIERIRNRKLSTIVADDSPLNVTMLCAFFTKVSTRVLEIANDGLQALEKYKKSIEAGLTVDIVTLDIDMLKMNGKTTCQKIREYERKKKLAPTLIVLISGNYDEEQVKECLDANGNQKADCFLRKPLLFEDFLSAIDRLKLKNRGLRCQRQIIMGR